MYGDRNFSIGMEATPVPQGQGSVENTMDALQLTGTDLEIVLARLLRIVDIGSIHVCSLRELSYRLGRQPEAPISPTSITSNADALLEQIFMAITRIETIQHENVDVIVQLQKAI